MKPGGVLSTLLLALTLIFVDLPSSSTDAAQTGNLSMLGTTQLTVEDHTRIVAEIMSSMASLSKILDFEAYKRQGRKPSGPEVLQAALQVGRIDAYTKGRIREVLKVWSVIEGTQGRLPPLTRQALGEIRRSVQFGPVNA